jgi:hypothetical protein
MIESGELNTAEMSIVLREQRKLKKELERRKEIK